MRSCLDEGQCVASLLLKNKAEALVAGICAKVSFFILVEVLQYISDFLTFAKAASNSSVQVYSFLVLRSGHNGASKIAMVGVLADS